MSNRRDIVRGVGWLLMAIGGVVLLWGARTAFQVTGAARPVVILTEVPIAPSATLTEVPITPSVTLTEVPITPSATVTRTPEPIVPTPTPMRLTTKTPESRMTPQPSSTPRLSDAQPMVTETVTPGLDPDLQTATPDVPLADTAPSASSGFVVPAEERFRLGVSLPVWNGVPWSGNPDILSALQVGWVMDWHARGSMLYGDAAAYVQTVRMRGGRLSLEAETLRNIAAARPGSTWLISNEPDVRWQDNVVPEVYARLYAEAYRAIKAGDPSALIAAGGISQPTELRLKYLDLVLQAYQSEFGAAMPTDAWHIHDYVLQESRDSWGVDIPPGLSENTGAMYGIGDSANLALFESHILRFRSWMANRGYRGQPLLISEFGIPMPADYGYPPDVVETFLRETWRYLLTATDPALGDPTDGSRLVQRWCWFSIEYHDYPTGDIFDGEANQWTPLGRAWLAMVDN